MHIFPDFFLFFILQCVKSNTKKKKKEREWLFWSDITLTVCSTISLAYEIVHSMYSLFYLIYALFSWRINIGHGKENKRAYGKKWMSLGWMQESSSYLS